MSNVELQTKVNDLREYRRMVDDLQGEIDAITDSIKQHMTAAGLDEIAGADYRITWREVTTARLDGKALKAALPEIAEQFTKSTTARRFTVA